MPEFEDQRAREEKKRAAESERGRERKGERSGGWMEEGREQTDRQASAFLSSESGREWKPSSFTYELDRRSPPPAPPPPPPLTSPPDSTLLRPLLPPPSSSFSTSCSSCRCALVVHRHRFHQFAINFNLKPPAKPLNPSRSQRLRSTPFAALPRAHAALSRPLAGPPSPALFERVPDWPRAFSFPSDPPSARDPTYVRRNAHR